LLELLHKGVMHNYWDFCYLRMLIYLFGMATLGGHDAAAADAAATDAAAADAADAADAAAMRGPASLRIIPVH
jgi:hypothetical protein